MSVADRPAAVDIGIGCPMPACASGGESLDSQPWRGGAEVGRDTRNGVNAIDELSDGNGSADARERVFRTSYALRRTHRPAK